jgi:hypothetical protein
MARRLFFAGCSVLVVAALVATSPRAVFGQGERASAEQGGDVLPTPPRPSAAWAPPGLSPGEALR